MYKVNNKIEEMYSELMTESEKNVNIQTSFDFTSIRDSFRQHVNNRRNVDASDLVILDSELVDSLITLKQKSFELLLNFKNARMANNPAKCTLKTFSSFEGFLNFVVNQEEILNSEQWKIEAINDYLNQLDLETHQNVTGTQGL